MLHIFDLVLFALLALTLLPPALLFVVELCLGQTLPTTRLRSSRQAGCVVLMPAKNEAAVIGRTLERLQPCLGPQDRVLVVADDCSDDTAAIARSRGAEVLERPASDRRGKGFTLDYGVQHLRDALPETVVVLDADSWLTEDSLDRLVARSQQTGRPVQSLYLMQATPAGGLKQTVSAFAWKTKNQIRATGLARLGGGVQLQGSGMAFPGVLLERFSFASGNIVEDLELGLALAETGQACLFEPQAVTLSLFPENTEGTESQRTRWIHGHLGIIATLPKRILGALARRQWRFAVLALDAAVPPTLLWVVILLATTGAAGLFALLSGETATLRLSASCLIASLAALTLTYLTHGRQMLPPRQLLDVAGLLLARLHVFPSFFSKRQTRWVVTRRDDEPDDPERR